MKKWYPSFKGGPYYELDEDYENEYKGMYFHPKLINTILIRTDIRYSCEVDEIMDNIDKNIK